MGTMLQILEMFGGVGAPRKGLVNLGVPIKSIDYIEIDPLAVDSYNAIFAKDIKYKPQSVVSWNLKPDILIHGSPCQDISIAGRQLGADEGSGTRSSLMWETLKIVRDMETWRPKIVIWENVKGVLSKRMRVNFNKYLDVMEGLGYVNSYQTLDARDFGLPQARERTFVVSQLNGDAFNFDLMRRKQMANIRDYLLDNCKVDPVYDVTQPSVLSVIGKKGIKRATIIDRWAYTITTRQDRTPAQVIDCGNSRFRYLTELECWRLQGYDDADYYAAESVTNRNGRYRMPLYKQAGNSIPVAFFESMFEVML